MSRFFYGRSKKKTMLTKPGNSKLKSLGHTYLRRIAQLFTGFVNGIFDIHSIELQLVAGWR